MYVFVVCVLCVSLLCVVVVSVNVFAVSVNVFVVFVGCLVVLFHPLKFSNKPISSCFLAPG